MNEANRLARVLGKACCVGVPIFDLLGEIAEAGGLEVVRAEIDGDHQGVTASLVIRRAGQDLAMVCHPADALARRRPFTRDRGAILCGLDEGRRGPA